MDDAILLITELTGPAPRTVTLTKAARTIPFHLPQATKQREHKTYYPGYSVASSQLLGPQHEDIHLEGRLDDRYMLQATTQNIGSILTAMDMRRLMQGIAADGRLCRLAWEDVDVRGIVASVDFTIQAASKIDYKLTFSVHDNSEVPAQVARRSRPPADVAQDLLTLASDLPRVGYRWPTWLSILGAYAQGIADIIDSAANAIGEINNLIYGTISSLNSMVDSILTSVDGLVSQARKLASVFGQVQSLCCDLLDEVSTMAYETMAAINTNVISPLQSTGALPSPMAPVSTADVPLATDTTTSSASQDTSSPLQVFAFADLLEALAGTARRMILLSQEGLESLAPMLPEWIIHIVKGDQTLQGIAKLYWGDSAGWQTIASDNYIEPGDQLGRGDVLLVRMSR
jgi:hypothetical protein